MGYLREKKELLIMLTFVIITLLSGILGFVVDIPVWVSEISGAIFVLIVTPLISFSVIIVIAMYQISRFFVNLYGLDDD